MVNIEWNKAVRAYTLTSSVTLPVSRQQLFDFFSDAFQLEQITPPWLHFHVTTAAPIDIQAGALIDYKLRLRGIPIRWRTEISTWDPPSSFTDRQLKGPYSLWEHFHTFEEVEGGTLVKDQVNYRVIGGAIVHSLFVKNDLIKIFGYRRQRMIELFADADSSNHSA
jgi:ligand-binding SRPBCC domain-containing protein